MNREPVAGPTLSHPSAGLVSDRPAGRQTHYRPRPEALAPLADWTQQMQGFWAGRFDALEDLLKRMDQ